MCARKNRYRQNRARLMAKIGPKTSQQRYECTCQCRSYQSNFLSVNSRSDHASDSLSPRPEDWQSRWTISGKWRRDGFVMNTIPCLGLLGSVGSGGRQFLRRIPMNLFIRCHDKATQFSLRTRRLFFAGMHRHGNMVSFLRLYIATPTWTPLDTPRATRNHDDKAKITDVIESDFERQS